MLFIQLAQSNPKFFLMWIFFVIFSVCMHEYAHAQTALWLGDSTAAEQGHLTLNPMKQMGLFSIITLVLLGICWGNVPINYFRLKTRTRIVLTAFAGPGCNLLLFFILCLTASIIIVKSDSGSSSEIVQFLAIGGMLNIVLVLFNMIPVPPLDGWVIVSIFFPGVQKVNSEVRNGIIFALFALLFFSFNKLFIAAEFCVNSTVNTLIRVLQ